MIKSTPRSFRRLWLQLVSVGFLLLLQNSALSQDPPPDGTQPDELIINGIVGEPINFPLDPPAEITSISVTGLPAGLTYDETSLSITGQIDTVGEYSAQIDFVDSTGTSGSMPIRIGIFTPEDFPGEPGFEIVINVNVGDPIYYQVSVPQDATDLNVVGLPQGVSYNDTENSISGSLSQPGDYFGSIDFNQAGQPHSIPVKIFVDGSATGGPGDGTQPDELVLNGIVGEPIDFPLDPPAEITSISVTGLPAGLIYNDASLSITGQIDTVGEYFAQLDFVDATGTSGSIPIRIGIFTPETFPGNGPGEPQDIIIDAMVGQYIHHQLPLPSDITDLVINGLPDGLTLDSTDAAIDGSVSQQGEYYGSVDFNEASQARSIPLKIFIHSDSTTAGGDPNNPPPEGDNLHVNVIVGQTLDFPLEPGPDITDIVFTGLPAGIVFDAELLRLTGTLDTEGHFDAQVDFVELGEPMSMPVYIDAFLAENFPGDPNNPNPPEQHHPEPYKVYGVAGQPLSYPLPFDLTAVGLDFGTYEDGTPSMPPPGIELNAATGEFTGIPEAPGYYFFILLVTDGGGTHEEYFDFDIAPAGYDDGTGNHIPPVNIIGDVGQYLEFYLQLPEGMTELGWDYLPEGITWDESQLKLSGAPVAPGWFETGLNGKIGEAPVRVPVFFDIFGDYSGGPGGNEEFKIFGFVGEFITFGLPIDPSFATVELGTYDDGTPATFPVGIEIDAANGMIVGYPQEGGFFGSMIKITEGEDVRQVPVFFDIQYQYNGGDPNSGGPNPPEFQDDDETVIFGTVGTRFSFKFPSSDSETISLPTEWEGETFGLPTGLSYNPDTNAIVGSPTESGIFDTLIRIEHADGTEKLKFVLFLVSDAGSAPKLSRYSETEYSINQSFEYQILASGTPTEYALEETPAELTFDTTAGTVSGSLDHEAEFDLIVKASNAAGDAYGILTLDVFDPQFQGPEPGNENPDHVENDLEPLVGRVGVPFRIQAPEEFADATFATVGDSVFPAGLGFSSTENAVISGTPTEAGLTRTHISITQGEKVTEVILTFFITDGTAAPQFVSSDYIHTGVGKPFELPLILANGPATIDIVGEVPGISYDATTKTLKGTLTEPGFHELLAVASNDDGKGFLSIEIDVWDDGSFQDPTEVYPINVFGIVEEILDFPLPADPARSVVEFVNAPDGTPSTIPPGLEYLPDYALIKGIPSEPGFFDLHIEVTEFGFTRREHIIFEIYTHDTIPDDGSFPTGPGYDEPDDGHVEPIIGKVGERLYFEAPIRGENIFFEIVNGKDGEESELPPGITFNATDGILSGVPTASGIYPVWVKVDDHGHVSTHFAPVIVSGPEGSPVITSPDFITIVPNENFEYQVEATNEPTSSKIDFFDVPGILSYDAETMVLNGKFEFGGFFTMLVQAENDTGIGYGLLNVDVLGDFGGDGGDGGFLPDIPLQINGTVDEEIDFELPSFVRGSSFLVGEDPGGFTTQLPDGLSIDEVTGRVYGTPTAPGFNFVYVHVDDGELPALALNIGIAPAKPTPVIISPEWWVGHQENYFQYQIQATDFPIEFFAENLPDGLSLNSATGLISGTPTTGGEVETTVSARNSAGTGETRSIFFFIEEKPRLPIVTAPFYLEAQVGEAFALQINATESPDSYYATGLPAGLSVNQDTGEISGTPTRDGFFNVRLEASNEWGMGVFHTSILVKRAALAPSYTGPTHVGGKVGAFFNFLPPAAGDVTAWAIAEDSPSALPDGLSINETSGLISGTPTETLSGIVELEITGPGGSVIAPVYFKVVPALDAPLVSSSSIARGTTGQSFSYQIVANNSPTEYAADNVPEGLSIDTATGVISGAPASAGYHDLHIRARNVAGWGPSKLLILDILPGLQAPMITSAPYQKGQVGQAFSYQIAANNQPSGYAVAGDLPEGLSLDTSTGLISGTPAKAGVTEVILSASNASGSGNGLVFIIAIRPSLEMPKITSSGTAFGKVNEPFVYQILATGTPTSYAVENLPDGLTLNETTGFITGTPNTATSEPVILVMVATNSAGQSLPRAVILEILPAAQAPVILSGGQAIGKVGDEFQFQVFATNEPTSFFTPSLPQGLSINSSTGLISGTPEQAGEFLIELKASNDAGSGEPAVLVLFILPDAEMPRITSGPYAGGKVGEDFEYQILVSSESVDSYQVEGDLPRGIDFDPTTGLISGSPVEPGVSAVYLSATNDAGTSMPQPLTIKIDPSLEAPNITSALRASGKVGDEFSFEITASNMPEDRPLPPSAELDAIGLPSGLGVNAATGIISGTPEEAGLFIVTLVATNETGQGNPKYMYLKIQAALDAPVISSPQKVSAQVGKSFSYQIVASNSPNSYDADHDISWLGVNTATGKLSGTPTEPGTYYAGLFAENESGASDMAPLEIVVYPAAETPKITSEREATGKIGNEFSYQIEATNDPTSFTVSGLPAGLTLDPTTGEISGSPSASGSFEIVMLAANANGKGDAAIVVFEISSRIEITVNTTPGEYPSHI